MWDDTAQNKVSVQNKVSTMKYLHPTANNVQAWMLTPAEDN